MILALTRKSYRALENLLADGKVRAIGVRSLMAAHLATLLDRATVVPAVNQIEVYPYFAVAESAQAFGAEHGILTQAWSHRSAPSVPPRVMAPPQRPRYRGDRHRPREQPRPSDAAPGLAAETVGYSQVHLAQPIAENIDVFASSCPATS